MEVNMERDFFVTTENCYGWNSGIPFEFPLTIIQKELRVNCVISAFSIVGKNSKNRRYMVMV